MKVKHISFDFWNTLAIANPNFAAERKIILGAWAVRDSPYVDDIYKRVKKEIDAQVAVCNKYSPERSFLALQNALGVPDDRRTLHHFTELQARIWKSFYENPPTFNIDTLIELDRLKEAGYSLSIGSNTNFIPGRVIREALRAKSKFDPTYLDIDLFDFTMFSDEEFYVKPDESFFWRIRSMAPSGVWTQDILHIGDSQTFDYDPAIKFGFHAHLINNPAELPAFLKTL